MASELILKSNPVGVDVMVNTIQAALYAARVTNGTWTNYKSYHRAYKNESDDGILPEVFTGVDNEYKDVFNDDDFDVTSFFLVSDETEVSDGMFTADISVIFQVNLSNLYTTAPHRFDEEFKSNVVSVFRSLNGRFTFNRTIDNIDGVYAGLDTSKVKWDNMDKFHVVRFELSVNYAHNCGVTFATGGVTCDITVDVDVTPESVLGAEDGTATATPSNDQGDLTYAWTGPNGFTSTLQNLTGLAAGTYTVIVTDDIIESPVCTATDSGTVDAGAIDPDAQLYITAAGITDPTEQLAANHIIVGLKGLSLWETRLYYLYLYLGSTAESTSYNARDTSSNKITWIGGVAFSANGAKGNGTNGCGDTGFNPNGIIDKDSFSLGYYSRTNSASASMADAGCKEGSDLCVVEIFQSKFITLINQTTSSNTAISNSDKFIIGTRTGANTVKGYRDGAEADSHAITSSAAPDRNIRVMCFDDNGVGKFFSNREHGLDICLDGVTPTEVTNLTTLVNETMVILSRNV